MLRCSDRVHILSDTLAPEPVKYCNFFTAIISYAFHPIRFLVNAIEGGKYEDNETLSTIWKAFNRFVCSFFVSAKTV